MGVADRGADDREQVDQPRTIPIPIAAWLALVIDDGNGARLRACSRAGCGTVFIDTSRNGRRHFCSVRCANQVNVANHRLRRRQELPR